MRDAEEHGEKKVTVDEIATMHFKDEDAMFLRTVSPDVRRKFQDIWNNEDIPSESLRTLKRKEQCETAANCCKCCCITAMQISSHIHLLAVSLLNAKQLEEYSRWATKRYYVLKAREKELSKLSPDAKRILRRMSNKHDEYEELNVPPSVKRELQNFVTALYRRRYNLQN
ncbi:hypothetical protein DICVIV_09227 [Dictyocaulus viviparus]|uniref:Uncharacterized protein n=1 Tax=Dictyocaulus viviparus TaxID=29172 RepID=A0A0D8XQY2_DICVI|nr:hypothetical protein DICVIV_09227 [Dictyocaulus viviparus]